MSPPKKNGNDPVTHDWCDARHGSTKMLLYGTFGGVLLVLGFGVTSSIIAYNSASSVNYIEKQITEIKLDVREIRTTQKEILAEEHVGIRKRQDSLNGGS